MITVASKLRQKRKIKAVPCFTRLHGHYMGDQFGQELCRGTLTIVDTRRPQLVLETGLPIRYYIPEQDVQMERLEPTETTTRCAYKGRQRIGPPRLASGSSRTSCGATANRWPPVRQSPTSCAFSMN